MQAGKLVSRSAEGSEATKGASDMSITIYTKPGCPYCKAAKEDFARRGVEYHEIDVYQNSVEAEEMFRKVGSKAVPIIVDGDEVTVGFGGY